MPPPGEVTEASRPGGSVPPPTAGSVPAVQAYAVVHPAGQAVVTEVVRLAVPLEEIRFRGLASVYGAESVHVTW